MAKYVGYKRPKDTKKTIKHLLVYLGYHKWSFVLVALLVFISAGANIMGTYLLKPVINKFIVPGDTTGLIRAVISMGVMYLCGALSTFAYNRLMVVTSQKVIKEIRNDLFAHTQKLPLSYFDAHSHGELMSRFTNDVDTVQEAMNSSFAMIIQSFMQLFGTIVMMMVLSVRLSLIVIVFLVLMFIFIKMNGKQSKKYFNRQQAELGRINGFVQEMMAGYRICALMTINYLILDLRPHFLPMSVIKSRSSTFSIFRRLFSYLYSCRVMAGFRPLCLGVTCIAFLHSRFSKSWIGLSPFSPSLSATSPWLIPLSSIRLISGRSFCTF